MKIILFGCLRETFLAVAICTALLSTGVLEQHARELLDLFPDSTESRQGMKTEALTVIWDDWD